MQINRQDLRRLEVAAEEKAAFQLLRKIKRKAPVDKGQLRAQYTIVKGTPGSGTKIVNTTPHALPIEYGTVPFTPPLRPLKDWGVRVLGSEQAGVNVWHKIRKKGIRPQPHVRPAITELETEWR